VGWCQYGTPAELPSCRAAELPNINNKKKYDVAAEDPPTWRIGCVGFPVVLVT